MCCKNILSNAIEKINVLSLGLVPPIVVNHPARKAFLLLPWFWRTWERLCLNQERSLLSLRWMFLGYIFEHRTNSHALDVVCSVITIAVSINGCYSRKSHNAVWRELAQRFGLSWPQWLDVIQEEPPFQPSLSRKQKEAVLAGWWLTG